MSAQSTEVWAASGPVLQGRRSRPGFGAACGPIVQLAVHLRSVTQPFAIPVVAGVPRRGWLDRKRKVIAIRTSDPAYDDCQKVTVQNSSQIRPRALPQMAPI